VSADPAAGVGLERLLDLQERDLAIDRLRHRRDTLPERAALAAIQADLDAIERERAGIAPQRDEAAREEQRLDDEATSIEEKAAEVERQLYSGTISSPRELQAMQADVEQLRRHRSSLEDRELEVMERREGFDKVLADLQSRSGELDAQAGTLRATLAADEATIDGEIATERAARTEIAAELTTTVVEEYERRRAQARGVGAARLVGTSCQGCHLSIPSVEAERIRKAPPGTLAFCDNCGCILVP
jgi:predicted  nucleic acid-binding Zn-ribbon protein